jgi:hypothetical protein
MVQEHHVERFHKYLFRSIILFVVMICTTVSPIVRDHQPVLSQYQITNVASGGLKVYTKFTGNQFIIINNDPFDWMNVTVAVTAKRIDRQVVSGGGDRDELIHAIPRIRSGGMYTLETRPLSVNVATQTEALTAQAYHLRISSMTPWGWSSWDGRWE